MATKLEVKLNHILDEKTEKIIPANIRAGVNIFGIVGTCSSAMTDAEYTKAVLDMKNLLGNTAYTELAYIQSDGTQCIDTRYTPNDNTSIQFTISDAIFKQATVVFSANTRYDNGTYMVYMYTPALQWAYSSYTITNDLTSKHTIRII